MVSLLCIIENAFSPEKIKMIPVYMKKFNCDWVFALITDNYWIEACNSSVPNFTFNCNVYLEELAYGIHFGP